MCRCDPRFRYDSMHEYQKKNFDVFMGYRWVCQPSDAKHLASSPSEHSLHLRNLTTNREEGSCDVIAEFASKNTTYANL